MRLNHKALKLVEIGLSSKTVSKLNENQINVLYSRLLSEAQTTTRTETTYTKDEVERMKSQNTSLPGGKTVKVNTDGSLTVTKEGKLDEDDDIEINNDPDATKDGMGMFEREIGEAKKKKPNPYAICTTTLGKEFGTTKRSEWTKSQEKKYERCKAKIDESLKEGKNPVSLFLEEQIEKIVQKHMPPKMTKKEIINYLIEAPADAPVKDPKTKPTTKPGTRPSNPNKNPFPKEHPAPKAKLPEPEEAKDTILDLIMNLIKKNEK
jgi:hypothetical protein